MSDDVSRETVCLPLNIKAQIAARAAGHRKNVRHGGLLCSHCLKAPPKSANDRFCGPCRAAYERDRRKQERAELLRLRALEESLKSKERAEQ
ncbi:MAG TPA: hypothetical protein VGC27_03140 [Rhizomicrobium sp.]